ncbi:hypothetical protein AKO1_009004 [Acrasis kona]|uniref:Major sperm protein n=1 Tax=Acrasis kona TaxID=1008807 RepID=A0AAW2ZJY8_9EUKA
MSNEVLEMVLSNAARTSSSLSLHTRSLTSKVDDFVRSRSSSQSFSSRKSIKLLYGGSGAQSVSTSPVSRFPSPRRSPQYSPRCDTSPIEDIVVSDATLHWLKEGHCTNKKERHLITIYPDDKSFSVTIKNQCDLSEIRVRVTLSTNGSNITNAVYSIGCKSKLELPLSLLELSSHPYELCITIRNKSLFNTRRTEYAVELFYTDSEIVKEIQYFEKRKSTAGTLQKPEVQYDDMFVMYD